MPTMSKLLQDVAAAVRENADELTELDRAIGDGDHGANLRRGFDAVAELAPELDAMPPGQALQKAGMTLVMKVGGASGPLYGSLLMGIGKSLAGASTAGTGTPSLAAIADALQAGVDMVRQRGKSDTGDKTMLDVLVPVLRGAARGPVAGAPGPPVARRPEHGGRPRPRVHPCAPGAQGARLVPGRAQRRPSRPRGPFEPAHRGRRVREPARRVMSIPVPARNVGVVIVSHSPHVARGAEDMVRQMVGESVPLAACGGNPDGGLGTDVAAISAAIDTAWSDRGVAVLVDLGGAEMNAEMAIEMLDEGRRGLVTICNAAVVEGAVMAATEASMGSALAAVCAAAEEAI